MIARAVAIAVVAAACATPAAARTVRDCPDCPELIVVPAGVFLMGSEPEEPRRLALNEYWGARERPRHQVRVARAFAMGRTEVTRAQFAAFVADTGYSPAAGCWRFEGDEWRMNDAGTWRDPGIPQTDDHPVTCVNWHDANAYVAWLSRKTGRAYRLPSEAEWEYAARAGRQTAWWWGDDAADVCKFANLGDLATRNATDWATKKTGYSAVMTDWKGEPCDDGHPWTAPVASFPANPFGFHDLGGNANEWVADCWNDDYARGPVTQDARLDSGDCNVRAMRGQGWTGGAAGVRAAFRLKMNAADRRFTFGFRVVRDARGRSR